MRTETIMVCDDCRIAISNDDYTGLDYHYSSRAEAEARETAIRHGISSDGGHLVMSDESADFSSKPCECCQDTLYGERFKCTVIINNGREC